MKQDSSDIRRSLGLLMNKERREHGWTQMEVAAKLGISQPVYCQYEKGTRGMDLDTLLKVLDLYGINFEEFRNRYKGE